MTQSKIKATKRESVKGKIILADGKEYELVQLNANMMISLEDKFDKSLTELLTPPISMKVLVALLHVRIHPNYPEVTEEQLGELVTDEVLLHFAKTVRV
jgi:hypothetical protein